MSVRILSYRDLILTDLKNYDYIINRAIHPNYFKYKYNDKFVIDIKIAKFIKKFKSKYIFLNNRKIYNKKFNIKEGANCTPIDNYSKNKLKTEKKLLKIKKNID